MKARYLKVPGFYISANERSAAFFICGVYQNVAFSPR
jgi:hypothetical protein